MAAQQTQILVVDDNEHNRDMLARRLQRQGYRVTLAEHGRQALDLLQAERYDLMLLDIMMPELNGYQVLEFVKADPILRHIPVIMISAIDDIDSVVRCIELGAEDYLFKPFNPVLLRARIDASLEKKRLRDQERAHLQSLQRELAFGRRIQAGFLPETLPQPLGWEVAAAFHPAREIAGDFYDVFVLANHRLGLVIADVCDKGIGAALYMALIRGLIRTYAERAAIIGTQPLDAVAQTNDYITNHHHRSRPPMFATLFFGVLDLNSATLQYVNAGHYPPLLSRPTNSLVALEPTGPAVGIAAGSQYLIDSVALLPGDLLIAYTDGLIEARQSNGPFFSEERLALLLAEPIQDAAGTLNRIEQAMQEHLAGEAPHDDVTLLAMYRNHTQDGSSA